MVADGKAFPRMTTVAAVALRPCGGSWVVVGLAGLCPLGAAVLQIVYLGFVPPTALLLGIALLAFAAAWLGRRAA